MCVTSICAPLLWLCVWFCGFVCVCVSSADGVVVVILLFVCGYVPALVVVWMEVGCCPVGTGWDFAFDVHLLVFSFASIRLGRITR